MSTTTGPAATPDQKPATTAAREAKCLQLQAAGLTPDEVEQTLKVLFGHQVRTIVAAVDAALPQLERDQPGTYKTYAPSTSPPTSSSPASTSPTTPPAPPTTTSPPTWTSSPSSEPGCSNLTATVASAALDRSGEARRSTAPR